MYKSLESVFMVADPEDTNESNPLMFNNPELIVPVIPKSAVKSFLSTVKLSKLAELEADELEANTSFSNDSSLERIEVGIVGCGNGVGEVCAEEVAFVV